jgi:hypothetical protein
MQASTETVRESRPSATMFMQRSRSVTTPTIFWLCSFSMTGMIPVSSLRMMPAARGAGSDGTQQLGFLVMT